jgi:hypothetical protein
MSKSTQAKGKARNVSVPTTSGQLPSSILKTDDPPLTLWCLIEGQSSPFEVGIPASTDIGDLKEAIKVKKTPELDRYAADSLILFKVCHLRSSSSFEADCP